MDRVSRCVRAVWVAGLVSLVLVVAAAPARAAFPGRDGDLVVATGNGLELVAPGTTVASPICADVALCGHPAQPSVSANGRAIAFVDTTSGRPVVIAADGSCLWCLMGAPLTRRIGSEPAFTPGGQGVTVAGNGLWSVSLTGGRARRLLGGRVDGTVWSSRGLAAVVRGGWIWVGRPGHGQLRRLARGGSPSFSPDASRLAFADGGDVWIVRVAGGRERRLVRGGAPAWSPDGSQIAYIALGGAVEIVGVHGGRPHRVGAMQGTSLDWQPLPGSERPTCQRPRGSTVLASSGEAVVFSLYGTVYGCLKALGRTRVLDNPSDDHYGVTAARLAGRFAALEAYESQADVTYETLYDLGSGHATLLATTIPPDQSPVDVPDVRLDSFALDSRGFAAWRETITPIPPGTYAISCPSVSLCVAQDGANILSSTNPTGGPSAWNSAAVASAISGVSCPSISLCVATTEGADVLTSTNPTGGASAWTKSKIDTVAYNAEGLNAVSCPSVSLCVATPDGGDVLTSTNPTGGASAWTRTKIDAGTANGAPAYLDAVSCPSVSLCVATTDGGDILTSTNPTGRASAWTNAKIDTDADNQLNAVSCPSASLCVAVDLQGNALTSTDPTGGASTWTKANIDPANIMNGVSCPSVSLCVAVDDAGNVLTSIDPTAGASAWIRTPADPQYGLQAVSCPSVSLCVAGGSNILSSTDPTGGAHTWTPALVVPGCAPESFPCISEQLYAHDDQGTRVVDTAPPGQGTSIGDITLGSLVLSWTHDGAQRQLHLR